MTPHQRAAVHVWKAARRSSLPSRENRFVRFGYRRPPPWQPPPSPPAPESPAFPHVAADTATWSELVDARLPLVPIPSPQDPSLVPALAHGMEPVLRGDGLYPLEAPWVLARGRSRGSPAPFYADSLRRIVPPGSIRWSNLPAYVPAESDPTLHTLAAGTPSVAYCSSTSSITPALAALYHLLSNFRATDLTGGLSRRIADLPGDFARMHRRPIAFTVAPQPRPGSDGGAPVYSVNAHSGDFPGPTILRDLGHSMERMLTTPPAEFAARYVLSARDAATPAGSHSPSSPEEQFYHYSRVSKFLLRAQIDCRNAATGDVFDVKTRAVAPIRYDLANYASFASHRLRFLRGKSDSYEREFYDMVRTVFLKYALQLRIGRMSGALVAYHNTTEILGLEFVPLQEIHSYVFGSERWADIAFGTAIHLLEEILGESTAALCAGESGEMLKVVLCTEWSRLKMYVFVQRLQKGEHDAFGSAAFLDAAGMLPTSAPLPSRHLTIDPPAALAADGQWHIDSYLHGKHRGLSVVGAHDSIAALGGERVRDNVGADATTRTAPRRRPGPDAFNYTSFNCAWLTSERFRVWELDAFPLVNDELAPRNSIRVAEGDCFRLRYRLQEVNKVKKEHLAKFVTSLGRIYTQ